MKLIKKLLLVLFVWQAVAVPFFVSPEKISAQDTCTLGGITLIPSNFPDGNVFFEDTENGVDQHPNTFFALKFNKAPPQGTYKITAWIDLGVAFHEPLQPEVNVAMNGNNTTTGNVAFDLAWRSNFQRFGSRYLKLESPDGDNCRILTYTVKDLAVQNNELISCKVIAFKQTDPANPNAICNNCFKPGEIFVRVYDAKDKNGDPFTGRFAVNIVPQLGGGTEFGEMNNGTALFTMNLDDDSVGKTYDIKIELPNSERDVCFTTIPSVQFSCDYANQCTYTDQGQGGVPYKLCNQIQDSATRRECELCALGNGTTQDPGGVWTAIGCIDRNPEAIIVMLITIGLGMGGGVALLMILIAGFILSTSQGDPKRTGEAKEMVTAAVIGLIFVIFSVTILQFIGVTVLQIPGFGG